jgi:hypothetical protein
MSGHRPFDRLTRGYSPERLAGIAEKAARMRSVMTLVELRRACDRTPEEIGIALATDAAEVVSLEQRADIQLGNLRCYIEAPGGTLEIAAHFGEARVDIAKPGDAPAACNLRSPTPPSPPDTRPKDSPAA